MIARAVSFCSVCAALLLTTVRREGNYGPKCRSTRPVQHSGKVVFVTSHAPRSLQDRPNCCCGRRGLGERAQSAAGVLRRRNQPFPRRVHEGSFTRKVDNCSRLPVMLQIDRFERSVRNWSLPPQGCKLAVRTYRRPGIGDQV